MNSKDNNKIQDNYNNIIYSTDENFVMPCEQTIIETLPKEQQKLKITLDTKQRKGKKVTLITGFIGNKKDLDSLSKTLKTKCSCGGSCEEDTILLQGDNREKVRQILLSLGYKPKG